MCSILVNLTFKIIISVAFCSTLCLTNETLNANFDKTLFVNKINNNTSRTANLIEARRQVGINCDAVFKNLQSVLISPNYPLNYPAKISCQYVFKSPYKCLSEYHIQFLDFDLESSRNCQNDFLAIGNIEILCGQISGVRKYNTSDGILELRFQTNNIVEARGFKLLISRLPCDEYYRNFTSDVNETIKVNNDPYLYTRKGTQDLKENHLDMDTPRYNVLPVKEENNSNNRQYLPTNGYLPTNPANQNPAINYGNNYQPRPLYPTYYPNSFGFNPIGETPFNQFWCQSPHTTHRPYYYPQPTDYPSKEIPHELFPEQPQNNFPTNHWPNRPIPSDRPTHPVFQPGYNPTFNYPQYPFNSPTNPSPSQIPTWLQYNFTRPQFESQFNPFLPDNLPSCCANTFAAKRFLLTSPGFPLKTSIPRDCIFYIEKFGPNVCRLRIIMKFFSLGQQVGDSCFDDFIEIDGRRLCGCRTGLIYTSQWGYGAKIIRLRTTGYQNTPKTTGFIFDIIQEDCPFRYSRSHPIIEKRSDIHNPPYAIIQTNSTTHVKYYLPDDPSRRPQKDYYPQRESPSSQFFYPKQLSNDNFCRIDSNDFQQIFNDRLWTSKPVCRTPNYTK